MNGIITAAALACAVGTVAQIGAATEVSRPLRMFLAARKKQWSRFAFDLISCPFCSGVWLSAAGTAIFRPGLAVASSAPFVLRFGLTWLAVASLAMLPVLWIRKALKA